MTDKATIWNKAATAGLILGAIPIAYQIISRLIAGISGLSGIAMAFIGLGSSLLWIAKFAGCIIVMAALMKSFAATSESIDNSDTFRFGMLSALLSAIVYSGYMLADMTLISAEFYRNSIDSAIEMMKPMMDSNARNALENALPGLPVAVFFFTLTYCFLFGTILSAILSRRIPSQNPFKNDKSDNSSAE